MDKERLLRMNDILREVSERGRPIDDLDEIPSWFEGTEEEVSAKVQEVRVLFDEAYDHGMLNRWVDESGRRGPSTYWDWTTTGHRKASQMGITLINPMGEDESGVETAMFESVPNVITTPIENIRVISTDALDHDACSWLNRVYQEQVRYIVRYLGKPVAALVPLVDLELLKDIQTQVDPCKWVEWIQNLRRRLGWPPVTFGEEDANG